MSGARGFFDAPLAHRYSVGGTVWVVTYFFQFLENGRTAVVLCVFHFTAKDFETEKQAMLHPVDLKRGSMGSILVEDEEFVRLFLFARNLAGFPRIQDCFVSIETYCREDAADSSFNLVEGL